MKALAGSRGRCRALLGGDLRAPRKNAREVVVAWMKTYNTTKTVEHRAREALEAEADAILRGGAQ